MRKALALVPVALLAGGLAACSTTASTHSTPTSTVQGPTIHPHVAQPVVPPSPDPVAKQTFKPHLITPKPAPVKHIVHVAQPKPQPVTTHTATEQPVQQPKPVVTHSAPRVTYRCTLMTDLGNPMTEYQQSYPVYYGGTAYCDESSVEIVQRDAAQQQQVKVTQNGGPVTCTYERMGEALCSDGSYASDPNEIPSFSK